MPLPLTPAEESLIVTATKVIDAVPRSKPEREIMDHTVSCAALSSTGRIFTGVNVFHFSGGPCAENVAFGNAAAAGVSSAYSPGVSAKNEQGELVKEKLVACVAVANDQRGVISPCGRCRQMILDYYPGLRVIVRGEGGLVSVSPQELLPFAYVSTFKRAIE